MSVTAILPGLVAILFIGILIHSVYLATKAPELSVQQLALSWVNGSIAIFGLILLGSFGHLMAQAGVQAFVDITVLSEIISFNLREVGVLFAGSFLLWGIIFTVFAAIGYLAAHEDQHHVH